MRLKVTATIEGALTRSPRPRRPFCYLRRPLIYLLMAATLVGCSGTTFVYNRLDFLVPWYVERYVDLDRTQAKRFDVALAPLLQWHRREELPRYVALIGEMLESLDQPLTVPIVDQYTDRLEIAWYRLRDRGLEELLILADDLSSEQIDEFLQALEKKQRKYERKYLDRDDDEFRDDAYDEIRDSLTDFLGRLDSAQRLRVRQASLDLLRTDDRWLSERAQWLLMLRRQLRREPGWQEDIRTTIRDWEAQLDPESMRVYDLNTRIIQDVLIDVINARNDRQDARLRRTLENYAQDFAVLSVQ